MPPFKLFTYLLALAGGLGVIGLVCLILLAAFYALRGAAQGAVGASASDAGRQAPSPSALTRAQILEKLPQKGTAPNESRP